MRQRRLRLVSVSLLRWLLTFAVGTVALAALLILHVSPSRSTIHKVSKEIGYKGWRRELSWTQEVAVPQLSRASKMGSSGASTQVGKLWKPPSRREFVPCVEPSSLYSNGVGSRGYLIVHTNGGLNQMSAGICDMVAVARIINATLVIPKLDRRSFWQDSSNFSDVFDEEHFINSLANDVKIVKKLPKEFAAATRAVKYFISWSGVEYYQNEISRLWDDYKVIRAAKSDSRLANNDLPPDIQKLRCRAFYQALRFGPRIEELGKLLVERMRSYGPYIALHLRYEKDMLAFSGCTYGLSSVEADELTKIRENTTYWKAKDIDSQEQRSKGFCPLTPKEVGIFLSSLGYPSNTPIYIASGEIFGGDTLMEDLESRFPILMSKRVTPLSNFPPASPPPAPLSVHRWRPSPPFSVSPSTVARPTQTAWSRSSDHSITVSPPSRPLCAPPRSGRTPSGWHTKISIKR